MTRYSDATGTTLAGGTAYTYDAAQRLVGIDHTNAAGTSVGNYSFAFDAADRMTGETFNGTTKSYTYDAAGQLTGDNGTALSYDGTGNRTNTGYVTTTGNRTTSDGTWTYTYDDAGQMTGKSKSGEAWAYSYDHRGQMTKADKSATVGGTVTDSVSYKTDAWGNRIERGQTGSVSSTERYVVDGWDTAKPGALGTEGFEAVMDLDSSNTVTARRVFGADFDSAVARQDAGGAVTWYGQDQVGSVRQVFDNSGNVTGSRSYSAFGDITVSAGTGQDRYGFTGTVRDALTGLVGDDARQYDPKLGKWTSDDPIGFGGGDPNLTRYVANGPTTGRDPSGLQFPGFSPGPTNAPGLTPVVDPYQLFLDSLRGPPTPPPPMKAATPSQQATMPPNWRMPTPGEWATIFGWHVVEKSVKDAPKHYVEDLAQGVVPGTMNPYRGPFPVHKNFNNPMNMAAYVYYPDPKAFGGCNYYQSWHNLGCNLLIKSADDSATAIGLAADGWGRPTSCALLMHGELKPNGVLGLKSYGNRNAVGTGSAFHENPPISYGKMQPPDGWKPPTITKDRHGKLTNGTHTLDEPGMAPHTTGTLKDGKSQFSYHVNEKELVLDAASYADKAGLWNDLGKAKIVFDRPIGVHAGSGKPTNVLNLYKTETGFVHGAPGSPGG